MANDQIEQPHTRRAQLLPEDAEINQLDQWVNLIDGRITNNQIDNDVRNSIIEQYQNNIDRLKWNLNMYRFIENRNRLMILPENNQLAQEAQEMAANEHNAIKNLILSQRNMVTDIDRMIDAAIAAANHGGGRRVRKSSSRPRRRSSKQRGTQRKQKRRQRRASRRASRRAY
jgi:hypothetical protein